ncbi:MAG: hypothetical protein ACOCTM_03100, partial [Bacteroidota bacterium]
NDSMEDWIYGLRYLMDYDKKNMTSEIEQRWDYRASEWNNAIRNLFSYDDEGEMKQMVEERWNRDLSGWETQNIFLYSDIRDIDVQQKPEEQKSEK